MGILGIILLVLFCIIALLLIFLVAVQDEKNAGLGGIFGGSSDSAFGSSTSTFLSKATTALAIIFMALSLIVAFANNTTYEVPEGSAAAAAPVETTSWVDSPSSDAAPAAAEEATAGEPIAE